MALNIRLAVLSGLLAFSVGAVAQAEEIKLSLRSQTPVSKGADIFHQTVKDETWRASETAVIVCDMWDSHHCFNAVERVNEFAPRLDKFLKEARKRGAVVIHCPSSCMDFYADHAARARAIKTPAAESFPADIRTWCYKIPSEEEGAYPIDQSDGGEDDLPEEHAKWAAHLKSIGRNPRAPWNRQIATLTIDEERDYITDKGDEVWSILENRGLKNVIMTGVHTNMCVLGRPFGLRRLASNGKNVALVRDLTDTMYNPLAKPFVSHFTGTDLIVSHVERYVCPTITSDQLLGDKPFRFSKDRRPRLAMIIAESEYETATTLPKFALANLGKDFSVSYYFADAEDPNSIPGLAQLAEADIALISVRRRTLPTEQLEHIKRFVASGKPVIGIRTASHAFALRGNAKPPAGHAVWPEFDAEVFGGSYTNHYGNELSSQIKQSPSAGKHPVFVAEKFQPFTQRGSLYKVSPLKSGTKVLLTGAIDEEKKEPVAWAFTRKDGGRSFYTSVGHRDDFANEAFAAFFRSAIYWAAHGKRPLVNN